MLVDNPSNRRSASDLFRELNKFEDEILSLRDFDLPTCQHEIMVTEPSIADFLNHDDFMMNKGGSMIINEEKMEVNKLNNSIQ